MSNVLLRLKRAVGTHRQHRSHAQARQFSIPEFRRKLCGRSFVVISLVVSTKGRVAEIGELFESLLADASAAFEVEFRSEGQKPSPCWMMR